MNLPVSDQVAPLVESYMTIRTSACAHCTLCDYRVAHCPEHYARGFDPAIWMNGLNILLVVLVSIGWGLMGLRGPRSLRNGRDWS